MKILGHPLHQILIVFPAGLLITAVVFEVAARMGQPQLWPTAYWMVAAGIIGGAVAGAFGFIDWRGVAAGTRARRIGALHGSGNLLVLALFGLSWWLREGPDAEPGVLASLLSLAGAALLGVTGWLGGELVVRHGVGVDQGANPDASSSLEAHDAIEWSGHGRLSKPDIRSR